jgi:hypothetical protein
VVFGSWSLGRRVSGSLGLWAFWASRSSWSLSSVLSQSPLSSLVLGHSPPSRHSSPSHSLGSPLAPSSSIPCPRRPSSVLDTATLLGPQRPGKHLPAPGRNSRAGGGPARGAQHAHARVGDSTEHGTRATKAVSSWAFDPGESSFVSRIVSRSEAASQRHAICPSRIPWDSILQ